MASAVIFSRVALGKYRPNMITSVRFENLSRRCAFSLLGPSSDENDGTTTVIGTSPARAKTTSIHAIGSSVSSGAAHNEGSESARWRPL